MDSVEWIGVGSAVFGFAIGWGLGRWSGRADLYEEITMRVDALRKIGKPIADMRNGQVPWAAIEKNLKAFPGQEKGTKR